MQREEIIDAMACVAQHVLGRKVVEFARIHHEGDQIAVLRDIPVESNTRFPYQMVVESASRKWLTSKDFQSLIPTVSKDLVWYGFRRVTLAGPFVGDRLTRE